MYKLTDAISSAASLATLQATYINIYMGVVLAFLAFMLNNWDKKKHPAAVAFLTSGMTLFFLANAYQLYVNQERANQLRLAIYRMAQNNMSSIPPELQTVFSYAPSLPSGLVLLALHAVVDVALIGLLWFNYRLSQSSQSSNAH